MSKAADAAREVADLIISDARTLEGPVVWVTGNSFFPAFRSFEIMDNLFWDDPDDFFEAVELVEQYLDEADVYLASPDYDNALFCTDLRRWRFREDADDAENLEDMFERITDSAE